MESRSRMEFTVEGKRSRASPTDWISFLNRDSIFIVSKVMNTLGLSIVNCWPRLRWMFNASVRREITSFTSFVTRRSPSVSKPQNKRCSLWEWWRRSSSTYGDCPRLNPLLKPSFAVAEVHWSPRKPSLHSPDSSKESYCSNVCCDL